MVMIRDTIDPTRERDVSDTELADLEAMGLVLTGTRARTDDGLRAAAVRQVVERRDAAAAAAAPPPSVAANAADGEQLGDDVDEPTDAGDDPDNNSAAPTDDTQES